MRNYIHAVDLATGNLKDFKMVTSNTGIDAFNLRTAIRYSVLDLIKNYENTISQKNIQLNL
ncbi:hypothetical protein BCV52_26545 [Priestia aryabhattai]|nr:hypothetical protein BCV52_26545 [Priestia aryabhattai]